jgi:FecR protein
MKNKFLSSFAVLTLALAGAFSAIALAQTTQEGPGPSEQPSAPMEMGQGETPPPPPSSQVYAGEQPTSTEQPQLGEQPEYGDRSQAGEEAQPGGPSGEAPAQTNQGVGRISMIHGDVSTQRGDSGDWSAAVMNQPVLNGDKVSTAAGARAEVQLDFANILRLGSNAQANIGTFTHDHIQIQLAQGLADFSVFNESEAEPEIDAPNVAVHPAHKDVILRIEVQPDGDTVVIVRKGEVQISTPKGIAEVKQGEMATVRGSAEEAQYKISQAPERDDWDRWNAERDHMIHSAQSWNHTNRYYTGSEDLDSHGRWENADDYGQVWVPNEPEGWAPYRDGNWVWEPSYGWTWVGSEPWGWAPYHYGRWMLYGNSWAWWPGPVYGGGFYRPLWAPAYVSFFGFGGGWGVGFGWGGWGGFGWLPIGPCDRFFPWWGGYGGRFGVVGFNRFGGLNRFGGIAPLRGGTRFSNLSHINDPHIGRAVSTVGAGRFGAGHITAVAATHAQLSSARMMTGSVPVVPTRASLSASGRAAAPSTIHNGASQRFYGSQSPARQQSFQQQTSHLQQSMQQNHFAPMSAGGRTASMAGVESRGLTNTSSGKPSAGTPSSGREMNAGTPRAGNSSANNYGNRGSSAAAPSGNIGNSRTFSPPNSTRPQSVQPAQSSPQRSVSPAQPAYRPEQASPSQSNRSGWSQFSPPSHSSAGASGQSGGYWNRTAPSSSYSPRSASAGSYGRGSVSSSRPQLNMRQPVVQPRSSGGYGGYRGSPGYSSPAYGGSRSTPSYGGSRGGYSGGSHSAPSSGGGHSSGGHSSGGGGGSHSSGGGHSSGGHSSGGHH